MERYVRIETLEDVRNGGHLLIAFCRHTNCRYQKEVGVDRLIQSVGARETLLPVRAELHFSDQMRCPSCKRRGMNFFVRPSTGRKEIFTKSAPPKQPNFEIVNCGRAPFSDHDVIATSDNLMVGRGAYVAAAMFYPDRRVVLKQGAFVVADSKDGSPIEFMTAAEFAAMREGEEWLGDPMRNKAPQLPKAS